MTNEDYVPFQDGIIFESQGYGKKSQKCEYCGKPAQHADCHAHRRDCPYYCGNDPVETPVPDGIFCLLLFTVVYLFIKKLRK